MAWTGSATATAQLQTYTIKSDEENGTLTLAVPEYTAALRELAVFDHPALLLGDGKKPMKVDIAFLGPHDCLEPCSIKDLSKPQPLLKKDFYAYRRQRWDMLFESWKTVPVKIVDLTELFVYGAKRPLSAVFIVSDYEKKDGDKKIAVPPLTDVLPNGELQGGPSIVNPRFENEEGHKHLVYAAPLELSAASFDNSNFANGSRSTTMVTLALIDEEQEAYLQAELELTQTIRHHTIEFYSAELPSVTQLSWVVARAHALPVTLRERVVNVIKRKIEWYIERGRACHIKLAQEGFSKLEKPKEDATDADKTDRVVRFCYTNGFREYRNAFAYELPLLLEILYKISPREKHWLDLTVVDILDLDAELANKVGLEQTLLINEWPQH